MVTVTVTVTNINAQTTADLHKMTQKKDATYKAKLQKARDELEAKGTNLRELCAEKDIDYQAARNVLCGKSKGRRGKAHHAAVFLGIKPNPEKLAA